MSGRKICTEALPKDRRANKVKSAFFDSYGCQPEFYVRVPGRVNLIGEHIDYSGYGVCPMALQQDILLAVTTDNEGTLRLANLDHAYANFQCSMTDVTINVNGAPEWHQYFLCGVKGIQEVLAKDVGLKGLKVLVSGTVPKSAGLSSSSALVCAAALAMAHAHGVDMDREEIASICAKCECYIGTQGGGMDQAIAFLATKGCAKLINFDPLRSEDVKLPPEAVFVISHSLAELNKAATADYNRRVVECRLAAQIIAKESGLDWKAIRKLGELQKKLQLNFKGMIQLVEKLLSQEEYTKDEILIKLEVDISTIEVTSLTENTRNMETFKLRQRALHVYQEALRVEQFHLICSSGGDGGGDVDCHSDNKLETLGKLMVASHASLRDLYECSHPRLDRLVELSVGNGGLACGARLTGAGWGGCVVALLHRENVAAYVAMLKKDFYRDQPDDKFASILFATEPQSGATIYLD